MKIRKSNGPRIEPCGTPRLIGRESDVVEPMRVSCDLLEK
jgi:hypothetical protein